MNEIRTSTTLKKIVSILITLVILLLIFQAGVTVGFRKGNYSKNWSQNFNYSRGLGDPNSIFSPFMMRDDDNINSHGTVGIIASVRLPNILVKGPESAEQVVIISTSTSIHRFRDLASSTQLRPGDQVIVIGEPDDSGAIKASFIRIMPDIKGPTSTDMMPPPGYKMSRPPETIYK